MAWAENTPHYCCDDWCRHMCSALNTHHWPAAPTDNTNLLPRERLMDSPFTRILTWLIFYTHFDTLTHSRSHMRECREPKDKRFTIHMKSTNYLPVYWDKLTNSFGHLWTFHESLLRSWWSPLHCTALLVLQSAARWPNLTGRNAGAGADHKRGLGLRSVTNHRVERVKSGLTYGSTMNLYYI